MTIERDFEDEGSLIPLEKDEILEVTVGYKAYYSPTVIFASLEGYATGFSWTVQETPQGAYQSLISGSLMIAAVISAISF